MNRIDIINNLIQKNSYKKYLEVGVQAGHCFSAINCETKVGVDPDTSSAATIHKTSNDFFENNQETFDIIFLDGLHHADQLKMDVINSLKVLNEGGTIVCHDMLPTSKRMQEIPLQEQVEWTGNVWQAWVELRQERSDLLMYVVDTDWGCGIIRKGSQELLKVQQPVYYEQWVQHKKEWMNIITISQFKQLFL